MRWLPDLFRGFLHDDWALTLAFVLLLELQLLLRLHGVALVATRLYEKVVDVVVVYYVRHILRVLLVLVQLLLTVLRLLVSNCALGRLREWSLDDVSSSVGDIGVVDLCG